MLLAPLVLATINLNKLRIVPLLKAVHRTIGEHWVKYALFALFVYLSNDSGAGHIYQTLVQLLFDYSIDASNVIIHATVGFINNMFCDGLSLLFFLFVPLICDTIVALRNPGQGVPQ